VATVAELSEPYGNLLLAPVAGPGVCRTCFNLTDGYDRCWACAHGGDALDLLLPISYSVRGGQLHHALASYKRTPAHWYEPFGRQLAAVLWRFLAGHEACVARAAGVPGFALVTTAPSGQPLRDDGHPLHAIVGAMVGPTRDRHRRLVRRTRPGTAHRYDPDGLAVSEPLDGRPVLIIDDMWTTGATVQATAAALKRAGAGAVAAVVIGRHINPEWHGIGGRLGRLPAPFDWSRCALCARTGLSTVAPGV
jgi:hypothetical protein